MAYIPVSEQAKTPPHTSHVNIDIQNTKHNPRRSVLRRDSYEKHPTLTELLETRHQQGFAEMKPIFSKSFLFVALVQSVNGLVGFGTSSRAKVGRVSAGPIEISSLGCGTWSWWVLTPLLPCNRVHTMYSLLNLHTLYIVLHTGETSYSGIMIQVKMKRYIVPTEQFEMRVLQSLILLIVTALLNLMEELKYCSVSLNVVTWRNPLLPIRNLTLEG